MATVKKHKELPRESLKEFAKRVGLKYVEEPGGVEFSPYHGGHHFTKQPRSVRSLPSAEVVVPHCLRVGS
jgi:hypothetical protein